MEGWQAVFVDVPDDPDPTEVVLFCPECWQRESGGSFARRFAHPSEEAAGAALEASTVIP